MQKFRQNPILILLIVNIVVGLFTFRSYGLSWDEPLFYNYADALRYAYSPKEWFSGNFDLNNAYGSSGTDHANRGPAYIIIARPFVSVVESLGADNASAWHLINFLTFQLGVYLLYRFSKRYMSAAAALAAAALFAWQPLLWGHAFINPKDPPFLVFFLGAVCFGFEMVDDIALLSPQSPAARTPLGAKSLLLASFFLGIATSIRVLGPLAGVLVGIYAIKTLKVFFVNQEFPKGRQTFRVYLPFLIKTFVIYAAFAILIAFITWPYLWTNPIQRFIEAFGFMSDNPTQLPVLFNGQIYQADQLPRRYLPVLLSLTLTEPVLILFAVGLLFAFLRKKLNTDYWQLFTVLLWFVIPFLYVILRKPPMYDGYRHFLFMLPPLFIFAGFAFEKIFALLKNYQLPPFDIAQGKFTHYSLLSILFSLLIFLPAIYSSIQLHPYQYAYYNTFIGGTSGAFRTYETEYWLTCYKEAIEQFDQLTLRQAQGTLFVKREPYIAAYYANKNISIRDYRAEFGKIKSGDFVLVNTRTNEDIKTFRDAPIILKISRGDAVFCEVKKIP